MGGIRWVLEINVIIKIKKEKQEEKENLTGFLNKFKKKWVKFHGF